MNTTHVKGDTPTYVALFKNAVKHFGSQTALTFKESSLSYDELDQQANQLAHYLLQSGAQRNQVIAVCMQQSMERVLAFLAVLKADMIYLPIDPELPDSRIQFMIKDADAQLILTDGTMHSASEVRQIPIIDLLRSATFKTLPSTTPEVRIDPDQGAYIIFTSGSTGKPKGVLINHGALSSFVKAQSDFLKLNPGDRTMQFASPSFDAAVLDIWVPLSQGASVYLYPDNKRVGHDLLKFIVEQGIEVITILPPAVLATLPIDQPIGKLKKLAIGGEAGNENTIRKWSKKVKLINSYGPTEATVAVTNHIFDQDDPNPRIIGKALPTSHLYILNEDQDKVAPGEVGELYIGGPQLASGYVNNRQLSDSCFITLKNGAVLPSSGSIRAYKTGDLVKLRKDGNIEFVGRKDQQVKIRGYRIEIGEIEHHLNTFEEVTTAAVKLHHPAENSLPHLLAFLQVNTDIESDLENQTTKIRKGLGEKLPSYMIPDKFVWLNNMPLTHAGKVDKNKLIPPKELLREASEQQLEGSSVKETLENFWKYYLNLDRVQDHENFFHLGGHSLMLANLYNNLPEAWKSVLTIGDFYHFPTLGEISYQVEKRLGEKQPDENERVAEIKQQLLVDSRLEETFKPEGPLPEHSLLRNPGHILLTGTTGFVGSHLLEELLLHTKAIIHCLVRSEDKAAGLERIKNTFKRFLLDWETSYSSRIEVIPGDLTLVQFGLNQKNYSDLAKIADVVYHCGSSVSYLEPYPVIRKPNIDGLKNILDFSINQKTKFLVLMSSMGVFSWGRPFTQTSWMNEKDSIDQNLEAVCRDLGYIRTKWVMEKLAEQAQNRGLPLINLRLGFAVCNGKTGATVRNQWWGALIKSCADLNAFPLVMGLKDELTTVDYMAAAIRHIGMSPEALGKNFHLSPLPENNVSLTDFCAKANEYFNLDMKGIDFHQWVALLKENTDLPVYPLLSLFTEKVHGEKTLVESYEHTYYYNRDHTESLLDGTGIRPPMFDKKIMEPYLKFLEIL